MEKGSMMFSGKKVTGWGISQILRFKNNIACRVGLQGISVEYISRDSFALHQLVFYLEIMHFLSAIACSAKSTHSLLGIFNCANKLTDMNLTNLTNLACSCFPVWSTWLVQARLVFWYRVEVIGALVIPMCSGLNHLSDCHCHLMCWFIRSHHLRHEATLLFSPALSPPSLSFIPSLYIYFWL